MDTEENIDTIDWVHLGNTQTYYTNMLKQYILPYILLTEKDQKRFRRYYPLLPRHRFQILQLVKIDSGTIMRVFDGEPDITM